MYVFIYILQLSENIIKTNPKAKLMKKFIYRNEIFLKINLIFSK